MDLEKISRQVRLDVLDASGTSGGGHLGGTFSCVEILVSIFFSDLFSFKSALSNKNNKRDYFILSKGHACLAYYSILRQLGEISEEKFYSFATNSGLGAQLDTSLPGVDWNTGSLGHSIGICAGLSLASTLEDKNGKAVTLIGDSELSEGSTWEAIAFCGDNKLSNVIVIVDRNRLSVTTRIDMDSIYKGLEQKIRLFDWNFIEIDGHSHDEIANSLNVAFNSKKPTMILANTIKGKGVPFMENNITWHHKKPSISELEVAKKELLKDLGGNP
jgi:transketolase